jgi:hypothetical protein
MAANAVMKTAVAGEREGQEEGRIEVGAQTKTGVDETEILIGVRQKEKVDRIQKMMMTGLDYRDTQTIVTGSGESVNRPEQESIF